jgi:hypothetical protein
VTNMVTAGVMSIANVYFLSKKNMLLLLESG